jgi:hypothetical protein
MLEEEEVCREWQALLSPTERGRRGMEGGRETETETDRETERLCI